jgi:hypothetical protein
MTEMSEPKPVPSRFGGLKLKVALGLGSAVMLAAPVAAEINWTEITDILDGVGTSLFPSLITLVTAAVPIIIIVTVVAFVTGFLDKILGMLKI